MNKQFDSNDDIDGGVSIDLEAGRRAFLRALGVGAGAVALGGAATDVALAQSAPSEGQVLNFALNLEYLEAEFYLRAATGSGLPDSAIGNNPGQVSGGKKVPFTSPIVAAYAKEIAKDEMNHVVFLRSVLGSAAVSRPPLNIGYAFTLAARAAGLIGPNDTFDAYADDTSFLLAAYIFEDVGVTAYHGAAPLLAGNPVYLDAAAGILAVEAYHAGLVRTALFVAGASDPTQKISALRQSLGFAASQFGTGKDSGVGTTSAPNIVLADSVGIAFNRGTRSVLNIVYGAKGADKGLFFPGGMNGAIR